MVIWVEAKNPALYSGGISLWMHNVVEILVRELDEQVVLVGPDSDKTKFKFGIEMKTLSVLWLERLPRKINHLLYDFFTFRFLAYTRRPSLIFSPYFDVVFPKSIPSIVTVHDLCFLEVPALYPSIQVKYYSRALKRSLNRAKYVVTVSESTRNAIASRGLFPIDKVLVLGNCLGKEFLRHTPTRAKLAELRQTFGNAPLLILYTGGYENRKNLNNLIHSLRILEEKGLAFAFVVTGHSEQDWNRLTLEMDSLNKRTHFVGHLDQTQLKDMYAAADVVVYPSFSEGFGRACIESMSVGTPLACSNIPVFREVASNYAEFFDPNDPVEIADGILRAAQTGRKKEIAQASSPKVEEVQEFLRIVRSASSQS
jgi:glycosyltransferase involved in cell wall biosynthesis